MKKIKGEIIEIQLKFEESLLTLFKKKLFIDVRVLEQELYLIRLVIMLHDAKETRLDEKKYREEMIRLEAEKASKEDMINYFKSIILAIFITFQKKLGFSVTYWIVFNFESSSCCLLIRLKMNQIGLILHLF